MHLKKIQPKIKQLEQSKKYKKSNNYLFYLFNFQFWEIKKCYFN